MKRYIPLLGVVLSAPIIIVISILALNHSVHHLPTTSGGGRQHGPSAMGDTSSNPADNHGGGNVITDIAHFFGLDSNADEHRASEKPGQGAAGGSFDPSYRTMRIFGTNISGLEFSGLFQPNTEQTYAYFKSKGMNTIRLPFDWNELQPDLYGGLDTTAKQYIDQNIAWAKAHGLAVILDAHNYGRRYIYRDGGFGDDFTSGTQHTFQLPYGDQDSTAGTLTFRDFGRGVAGTMSNPVAPHTGYKVTFDAKIDSFGGEAWDEFYMDVFYQDDNNRYSLVVNPVTNHWELRQTVNGAKTVLASGSKTWVPGQYDTFVIDVNQASPGKINVTVDGTALFAANTVSSNPALTHGKISMYPSGVKATIRHFTLDIGGDTSSGGPAERRVTDDGLPLDAWKDFWTKLSAAYKDETTVIGYDQNEPHDMPVPTTPSNYAADVAAAQGQTIATASAMGQSMLDAIRATGDDKFVVIDMDHWANTHYFSTQYGIDPQPWVKDSLAFSKVVYSGHYYFDSDHSGIYASGSTPPTDAQVSSDVAPFFNWCQRRGLICYEGEFGVPNTSEWQASLAHFLDLARNNNIWWTQWAGGDIYSSATTLQPTNSYTTDRLQMTTIQNFVGP